MTAIADRVQCPHCKYAADNEASLVAHVAMRHADAVVSPKRSARNATTSATTPAPDSDGSAPTGSRARRATPEQAPAHGGPTSLSIDAIVVEDNVREDLGDIEGLVESIREHGLLQAVLVDRREDGAWRLVDGHRRLEACRLVPLERIPVQVAEKTFEAGARTTVQIVANSQRKDLDAIEEARGFARIIESEGITQAELARRLGKAPSTIANRLRLLTLDAGVQEAISSGAVSAAHGVAIASLPAKQQREMVRAIVDEKLSAHGLEQRLEWKRSEATAEAARATRTEKQLPKMLAALEAAGVDKGGRVYLMSHYALDDGALRAALKKAGWTELERGYAWERPAEGKCDCSVVRLEFDRIWKVKPACADDRHRDRQRNTEHVQWQAEQKAREELLERARAAMRYELSIARPRERAVRLLAFALSGKWYGKEAELAAELGAKDLDALLDIVVTEAIDEHNTRGYDLEAFIADVVEAGWQGHAPADPAPELRKKAAAR